MKTKLIALSLFASTTAAVALYPDLQQITSDYPSPSIPLTASQQPAGSQRSKVGVVFVLDTTGSMSGLIQAAKEKHLVDCYHDGFGATCPGIRMVLVAYRDRGDAYVTKVIDLSSDLDSVYAALMEFEASGGGDGPESVNQALREAVENIQWRQDGQVYKTVFLVGDAPPHSDYQDEMQYPQFLQNAIRQCIAVNTVQCGQQRETRQTWQQIAALGKGEYFQVDQAGSAVAIASPFDKRLAELSEKLDKTRLYYGSDEEKAEKRRKQAATEKLHAEGAVESRARRAAFNASASGKANLIGDSEPVDDVASGRVDLDTLEQKALPATMQAMSPDEQKILINETARQRQVLQQEITALSGKRDSYLKQKVKEIGGAKGSLDQKLYSAVRKQAAKKGLLYEEDAVKY
ncbi:vWA domain-containing protein [Methylomonas sp. MgM2]